LKVGVSSVSQESSVIFSSSRKAPTAPKYPCGTEAENSIIFPYMLISYDVAFVEAYDQLMADILTYYCI